MSDFDLSELPEHPVSYSSPISTGTTFNLAPPVPSSLIIPTEYVQWMSGGKNIFFPSGQSQTVLPAGFYSVGQDNRGVYAERQPIVSDNLCVLPGSCNEHVIEGIRRFWQSKDLYKKHGLSYKRGVLFYGQAGSGKTASITLLSKELIDKHGGAVFMCQRVDLLTALLPKLRQIEPDRPLIVIIEDIDEIIQHQGEHDLLALLDGETQISNVTYLASTNYPERLGGRIVNRPSRFDERIEIQMPSDITRRAYLSIVSQDSIGNDLGRWVEDTDGMSIAHLRELVVAVHCLGRDYTDTVTRLKSMAKKPKTREGVGQDIGWTTAKRA
jgi:hypothetical protein